MDPALAMAHRPVRCLACEFVGLWHHHGLRSRWIQCGVDLRRLVVVRFRCPRCRLTATVLPDEILPGRGFDLDTVGKIIAAYLDGAVSYRELPLRILRLPTPVAASAWTLPVTPSPSASSCFRLVARFAAGARVWWAAAAAALQVKGDYVPPSPPEALASRARSDAKCRDLRDGWQAVHAWRLVAGDLGIAISRWPFVLRHAPVPPAGLDRTRWFVRPPPPA